MRRAFRRERSQMKLVRLQRHRRRARQRLCPGQPDQQSPHRLCRSGSWACRTERTPDRDNDGDCRHCSHRPERESSAPHDAGDRFHCVGVFELNPGIGNVMQPAVGILLEASVQQPHDARWSVGGQEAPIRRLAQDSGEGVLDGFAAEGLSPGQRFVEDAPERPDVGALVHGSSPRVFRAHVRRGAEDEACLSRGWTCCCRND